MALGRSRVGGSAGSTGARHGAHAAVDGGIERSHEGPRWIAVLARRTVETPFARPRARSGGNDVPRRSQTARGIDRRGRSTQYRGRRAGRPFGTGSSGRNRHCGAFARRELSRTAARGAGGSTGSILRAAWSPAHRHAHRSGSAGVARNRRFASLARCARGSAPHQRRRSGAVHRRTHSAYETRAGSRARAAAHTRSGRRRSRRNAADRSRGCRSGDGRKRTLARGELGEDLGCAPNLAARRATRRACRAALRRVGRNGVRTRRPRGRCGLGGL
jgi:hypothetical protein